MRIKLYQIMQLLFWNSCFKSLEVFYNWSENTVANIQLNMHSFGTVLCCSGGRLNKKDGLTRYGNSHVKDKTS